MAEAVVTVAVAVLELLRRRSVELLSRAEFLAEMERLGSADPASVGRALDAILSECELLIELAVEVAGLAQGRARVLS